MVEGSSASEDREELKAMKSLWCNFDFSVLVPQSACKSPTMFAIEMLFETFIETGSENASVVGHRLSSLACLPSRVRPFFRFAQCLQACGPGFGGCSDTLLRQMTYGKLDASLERLREMVENTRRILALLRPLQCNLAKLSATVYNADFAVAIEELRRAGGVNL